MKIEEDLGRDVWRGTGKGKKEEDDDVRAHGRLLDWIVFFFPSISLEDGLNI